ncbi:MAG: hypothetical protein GY820_03965 [Gammaproteobacteria bacterium]|nr:hypothetical protein [Gammaproteobacteria bacterium]
MKSILFALIITLLGINCSYAGGSTGYFDIKTIRVGGGFLRVVGVSSFNDPSSCSGSPTNTNVLIFEDTASYKEMVSFVLSAKMAGKKVNFWVSGCENDSGNSYPKAAFTYIQD